MDEWEAAARSFEPRPQRWPSPSDLALDVVPNYRVTPALRLISDALVDVEQGRCDRLVLSMAPQEGKTLIASTITPLWFLERNPDRRVALVSYQQDLADRISRDIRNLILANSGDEGTLDLGLRIAADNGAARRWQIDGRRGGIYAVGVSGGLTGRPVDGGLFIDDPFSNMEQAMSSRYRERVWNFWTSVGSTRLAPGTPVVVTATRWHEDDLIGRLLAAEDGYRWRVINIPAVAERGDDPLGREIGEGMISARGDRDWGAIKTTVGNYVWSALYQGRPSPAEGGLFKRDKFQYWTQIEQSSLGRPAIQCGGREIYMENLYRFLTVDLAASTKTSADYTVAGVWGITLDGDLILLDGLRERMDPSMHWGRINQLRTKWDAGMVHVEAAMNATTLVYEAGKAGIPISELKPDKDKTSRAIPAAARLDAQRLWVPSAAFAPWITDWIDELAAFGGGAAHDDVTDVFGYAARVAAAHWVPRQSHAEELAREVAPDPDEVNLFAAQW